jgi:hypothetical protein
MTPRPGNVSRSLLLGLSLLALACHAPPGGTTAATVSDGICAGAGVADAALDLVPRVVDVVRGGGSDWEATLDRIGAGVRTAGALACAVSRAAAHLSAAPATAAPGAPAAEPDASDASAASRARAYLKKLGAAAPALSSAAPAAAPGLPPPPVAAVAPGGLGGASAGCSGCSPSLRADLLPPCCPGYRAAPGGAPR